MENDWGEDWTQLCEMERGRERSYMRKMVAVEFREYYKRYRDSESMTPACIDKIDTYEKFINGITPKTTRIL